jgi:hypothetical protein
MGPFYLSSARREVSSQPLSADWQVRFGHPLWLLEAFVDPRFHGTCYRAANWLPVSESCGSRRTRAGYSNRPHTPKRLFVPALLADARARLYALDLDPRYHQGAPSMPLTADHMRSLPDYCAGVPDPGRGQRRRHPLPAALAMAAGAVLCGARGYKAIAAWAADLSQQARARFRCRYRNGRCEEPRRIRFRDLLISIPPEHLDRALRGWNAQMAGADEGLALDGTTMRSAIDERGRQTHILGAVGNQSQTCYTQKSHRLARRRWRRGQADQCDRHGHPPA